MFLYFGYTNEWWNKRHGISFDKETYMNPIKRMRDQEKMDTVMYEMFHKWRFLDHIDGNSRPPVSIEPYGHRFIPAMFGAPIDYQADQAPWAQTIKLERDYIMSLRPITEDEYANHPLVRDIIRQRGILMENGRVCTIRQNLGGVMNTAIYLRGDDLFYDFYDDPEMVHKLLDLITNMILVSYDHSCKIDGNWESPLGVGNCTVAMLSPQIYAEFLRPYDMRIMEHARAKGVSFGIHHDSLADPFIPVYKSFDYLNSFDIGCDTDVALFRREFPDVNINVYFYASTFINLNAKELFDFMVETAEKGGPLDKIGFTASDIDIDVPMDKVEAICEAYAYLKDKEERNRTSR